MGDEEIEFIHKAFDENWIAPLGPNVDGFEQDLVNYLHPEINSTKVAVLNSGTAALHLALVLNDVGPDDIVLVQSFTFCGSSNPVRYQGAKVVFIDSEPET